MLRFAQRHLTRRSALLLVVGCLLQTAAIAAADDAAPASPVPIPPAVPAKPLNALPWLQGSTHVHAAPSGDSSTSVPKVITWYEQHGYDFIVLTDHNRVTEAKPGANTKGKPYVRNPDKGLIVLAGVELTNNPDNCEPLSPGPRNAANERTLGAGPRNAANERTLGAGPRNGANERTLGAGPAAAPKCRIHVNGIGVTERPAGKIAWAAHQEPARIAKYAKAITTIRTLGRRALVQLNHPQWHWGMTAPVLEATVRGGARLVEIANVQFATWNAGDAEHPSMEVLWDSVLQQGLTAWAIASDDAHDYDDEGGKYPPGGGFVVVNARRKPAEIITALRNGKFYASTGVLLSKLHVVDGVLTVEVATMQPAGLPSKIEFIEDGKVVETIEGNAATRTVPSHGYLRATITRSDGAKAWVQPQRASAKRK